MSDESSAGRPNRSFLMTPPGTGAIATIRLTGPRVGSFLHCHFSRPATIGRAVHGNLFDGDEIIDDPLIATIDQQAVDINIHGGSWVTERTLMLATAAGFKWTPVALTLDGIESASEIEREVSEYLPFARTEETVRLLLRQPAAWRRLLNEPLRAFELQRMIDDRSLEWMLSLPRIAIIGPPNVGKSTLANHLFGTQRSIVADRPGTTRDWVGETANLDGLAVTLLDTPGVRVSDDEIEMTAIARAAEQVEIAELVVIVEDAERMDDPFVSEMAMNHPTAVRVVNKMDRINNSRTSFGESAIFTNGLTGEGVDSLRQKIRARFDCEKIDVTRACCWTDRQRQLLRASM